MPLTNAEKQRRWRERQAGRLPPIPCCPTCGRPAPAAAKHDGLCVYCWRISTPEGVAENRARQTRWREAQKRAAH